MIVFPFDAVSNGLFVVDILNVFFTKKVTMKFVNALLVPAVIASVSFSASAQIDASSVASQAAQQTQLVMLSSIEGKAANDEFTRNVQVLQAQYEEIVKLNEATNAAPAGKGHDALQAQLDAALKRLETDNQTMVKTYGYSILRNYVRIPEKSEIFIVLTPEEIVKQPKPTDGSDVAKTIKVCTLGDAQANQSFQTTVQNLQQMRQQAATLKVRLDSAAPDESQKSYLQGQFDLLLKQLNDANAVAKKSYVFDLNRQYVMSIEKSTLYIAATPEEAAKAAASAAAALAPAATAPAAPATK